MAATDEEPRIGQAVPESEEEEPERLNPVITRRDFLIGAGAGAVLGCQDQHRTPPGGHGPGAAPLLPHAHLVGLEVGVEERVEAAGRFLESAAKKLGWSSRSLHRVLKVARTVADLAGSEAISTSHVAEAVQLRRAIASN